MHALHDGLGSRESRVEGLRFRVGGVTDMLQCPYATLCQPYPHQAFRSGCGILDGDFEKLETILEDLSEEDEGNLGYIMEKTLPEPTFWTYGIFMNMGIRYRPQDFLILIVGNPNQGKP